MRRTRLPIVIDDAFQAGSSGILTHTLNALLPLQGEGGERLLAQHRCAAGIVRAAQITVFCRSPT